jgi:hypothetical protein
MDDQTLMRLHRRAKHQILEVDRQLASQKARGQDGGRRLSADAIIKRDEIAQAVIYIAAADPQRSRKLIIQDVGKHYGVQRTYVYSASRILIRSAGRS